MWKDLIKFLKRIDEKLTQGVYEHGLKLSNDLAVRNTHGRHGAVRNSYPKRLVLRRGR